MIMYQLAKPQDFRMMKDLLENCEKALMARMRADKAVAVGDFSSETDVDWRGDLVVKVSIEVDLYG